MTRRAPEKKVEAAGDELMKLFGFTPIRFSQARATMQTRGIPDRRYYLSVPASYVERPHATYVSFAQHRVVWWEAKAGTKQSAAQKNFQELVESCGETYLLGGVEALENYLVEQGLAKRVPGGIEGLRRKEAV